MKKLLSLLLIVNSFSFFQVESCPTCEGRIEKESPPFFTDEFYTPTAESMDSIYQQLLAEQEAEMHDTGEAS